MKELEVKFFNWFPTKDDEGDWFWSVSLLPDVQIMFFENEYCAETDLVFGWLFWQVSIVYKKRKINYD